LVTNDLFRITVTKGSPNTVAVTQNGTPVTLSASTYSLTLATLEASYGIYNNNVGTGAIKSLSVSDGLVTGGAMVANPISGRGGAAATPVSIH
jgi:hypothetical protein